MSCWSCSWCGDSFCDGCDPADWLPEGETLDARDATPPPPAVLDPRWVLVMRARIKQFRETGEWVR